MVSLDGINNSSDMSGVISSEIDDLLVNGELVVLGDTQLTSPLTIINPSYHPELNFKGSSNQYGLLQFQDSQGSTKSTIYSSNTSGALNIDFGNLPEGFKVKSSGVEKFSIDPNGNTVVSGLLTNNYDRIALGNNAGLTGQGLYSIAIGTQAGETDQKLNSLALGFQAGQLSQNAYSTAIGYWAGQDHQGFNTVAVGTLSGTITQGENSVALGVLAGYQYQKGDSVSVGTFAGSNRQGYGCLGLGFAAGGNDQGDKSVAIGWRCGNEAQGASSVAIGNECGRYSQGNSSVAVGFNCGFTGMGGSSVAVGYNCGADNQGSESVAVGYRCGETKQGTQSVAMGYNCGATTQGSGSVAVGYKCGEISQSSDAVAIGGQAGQYNQGHGCVSVGELCGQYNQTANSVAVGHECGRYTQGDQCVAMGYLCGATGQNFGSTAIGYECGKENQQSNAVAVGAQAGEISQGSGSVCIGNSAGQTNCGKNSICIGKKAGQTNSHDSTIVFNAHNSNALNTDGASRFYVQPIRNATGNGCMSYNDTTKEITYSSNGSFTTLTSNTASFTTLTSNTASFTTLTSNTASFTTLTSNTASFTTLTSNTASFTTLTSNTASFSGNVSISGLTIQPNTKENVGLTGSFQVGNMRTETLFPNTAWANNTPTGITLFNNRGATDIYKAYGTYNGYFESLTYYANTGLPNASANSWTIENGDTYKGEHVSFYYTAYTPLRPYSSVYFYNNASSQGRYIKSFVILGALPSTDTYVLVANITIPNPTEQYYHYSFPTIFNAEGMAFIVTSITSGAQASSSFRLSKLNFGYTDAPTQTFYIPQQLEVGNSAFDATANVSYDFICSGSSRFCGGVSFGDLSSWFPECRMRPANAGYGYYILPGGLCIQWSTDSTGTWTYQRPMDYVYTCQITRYGGGQGSGYGLKINTLTNTYVDYDSNYGSTGKYACYCMVIGKINQ